MLTKVCGSLSLRLLWGLICWVQYDRIDPAEVQALQDEITQLKKDKEELEAKVKELEDKVEAGNKLVRSLVSLVFHLDLTLLSLSMRL